MSNREQELAQLRAQRAAMRRAADQLRRQTRLRAAAVCAVIGVAAIIAAAYFGRGPCGSHSYVRDALNLIL